MVSNNLANVAKGPVVADKYGSIAVTAGRTLKAVGASSPDTRNVNPELLDMAKARVAKYADKGNDADLGIVVGNGSSQFGSLAERMLAASDFDVDGILPISPKGQLLDSLNDCVEKLKDVGETTVNLQDTDLLGNNVATAFDIPEVVLLPDKVVTDADIADMFSDFDGEDLAGTTAFVLIVSHVISLVSTLLLFGSFMGICFVG